MRKYLTTQVSAPAQEILLLARNTSVVTAALSTRIRKYGDVSGGRPRRFATSATSSPSGKQVTGNPLPPRNGAKGFAPSNTITTHRIHHHTYEPEHLVAPLSSLKY